MQPMMCIIWCNCRIKSNRIWKASICSISLLKIAVLTHEIGEETPTALLYQDVGNYRHSRRQLMQLQQLAVWREQIAKALNQPRSFILKTRP